MKVIQEGQGWSIIRDCTGIGNGGGGCGARLEVEKEDLFLTYSSCMGESETHVTFRCPLCRVLTDTNGVPYGITQALGKERPRH